MINKFLHSHTVKQVSSPTCWKKIKESLFLYMLTFYITSHLDIHIKNLHIKERSKLCVWGGGGGSQQTFEKNYNTISSIETLPFQTYLDLTHFLIYIYVKKEKNTSCRTLAYIP